MAHRKNNFCSQCGSPLEKMYSVESAAKLIDGSEQTIRKWIQNRQIGYVKIKRLVRIPQSELDKIIERRPSMDEIVHDILMR